MSAALVFGAVSSDRVVIPAAASINDLTAYTVIVVVNCSTRTSARNIIAKGQAGSGSFRLSLNGTTGNVSVAVGRATTDMQRITNDTPLATGVWKVFAFTVDQAGAVIHFYSCPLGGTLVESTYGTTNAGSGTFRTDNGSALTIGNNSANTLAFQGSIGDAVCYINGVLSIDQIQSLVNRFRRFSDNHVLFMPVGRNGAGTQTDFSGNVNNGTVTGATVGDGPPIGLYPSRGEMVGEANVLVAGGAMAMAITSSSTVAANLRGAGAMASAITTSSTVAANLRGTAALASAISTSSTVAATLRGAGKLLAAIATSSTVAANLRGAGAMASAIATNSTLAATLRGSAALASAISTSSTVAANLRGAGGMASAIATSSTVAAFGSVRVPITMAISASSTVSMALGGVAGLVLAIGTDTTVEGLLTNATPAGGLATMISGSSTVSATLSGLGALVMNVPTTSTISAQLRGVGSIAVAITTTTTVSLSGALVGALVMAIATNSNVVSALSAIAELVAAMATSTTMTGTLSKLGQRQYGPSTLQDWTLTGPALTDWTLTPSAVAEENVL